MFEEFSIRWEVHDARNWTDEYRSSPIYHHFGMPWRFEAGTETSKRTKHIKYFGIYLSCNEESECDLWRCERTATLTLIHWWNTDKNKIHEVRKPYTKAHSCWGFASLIEFETLLKPTEGFIKNNKMIVEARVQVKNVFYIRNMPSLDLFQPNSDWDNIVLKLEDGIVHGCRQFLKWHSSYFASLFNTGENSEELVLENVKIEEFTELLHVIPPSRKLINIELFLMNTVHVATAEKMFLAEQYRLESLMKHCFNSFKTLQAVKELEEKKTAFTKLSMSLKAALLAKVLELIKINPSVD